MELKEIDIKLKSLNVKGIHFDDKGYPTLAIHGWLDNANSFAPLIPKLENLNITAIDLPGHGKSEHHSKFNYFHYIDYILDILEVTQTLGFDKFNLIGHSLGAGLCTIFAGTFPEKVNKLCLLDGIGPVPYNAENGPANLRKATEQALATVQRVPVYKSIEEAIIARANSKLSPISLEAAKLLVDRGLIKNKEDYVWSNDPRLIHSSAVQITEEQLEYFIKNITADTL